MTTSPRTHLACLLAISISVTALLSACSSSSSGEGEKDAYTSEQDHNEMLMAENFIKSGNMEAAGNMYAQVFARSKSTDAGLELAALDRKLGHPGEAVDILKDIRGRHPDNAAVLTQLGYALMDAGKPEEAVDVFDALIALKPDSAPAYTGKGVAFDRAGNHLAAQELYTRALILTPDSLSVQNNMAMSMILNNQLDQAIAILEKLNQKHGDNKTVRQNLAMAYGLKGDQSRAMSLNLRDLSSEEAEDNNRFYARFAQKLEKLKPSDLPTNSQVGFAETPPEQKIAKAKPAAGRNVKVAHEKTEAAPVMDKAPEKAPEADKPVEAAKPAEAAPVAEKKPEPAPEPAVEKKAEPVAEKKAEPVEEKKAEPVAEKKPEPVAEKKAEPADKPAEPAAKPADTAAAPAEKPKKPKRAKRKSPAPLVTPTEESAKAPETPSTDAKPSLGTELPTSPERSSEYPSARRR